MDTVGTILILIIIIETVYCLDLRDQRKRLEIKLRRRTWEARGRDATLMEHMDEGELGTFMVQLVKDNRGFFSMEYLEEVLLKAIRERVLKDRGEPVSMNLLDTLTGKLMGDK